jgi:uncharacterized membrane protein
MAFCPNCGTQVQEGKAFCSGCGKPMVPGAQAGTGAAVAPASSPAVASGGMGDNVAGLLAYLFIPAIVFLVIEPYKTNRFVRFHSFQCLFFAAAWFVLWIILMIAGTVLMTIPFIGGAAALVLFPLVSLLGLVLGVFLMYKAWSGEKYKLPIIGAMAEKQADAL